MIPRIHTNYSNYLIGTVFFLLFTGFSIYKPIITNEYHKIEYMIKPTSSLHVNGKTNVNSFCCDSEERFESQDLLYKLGPSKHSVIFEDTEFKIKIKELDCGKRKINKDLFKALRVDEFPYITIHLKEVINTECSDISKCGEWLDFEAVTDITITCETEPIIIPIMVKILDKHSYRITGGADLKLCDFDIEAPTAMMGLIKVKDDIEFEFDLHVDLNT